MEEIKYSEYIEYDLTKTYRNLSLWENTAYDHDERIKIEAEAIIKERYDMTLDELDAFVEKYEPERTI
jgi:hypothetical protein